MKQRFSRNRAVWQMSPPSWRRGLKPLTTCPRPIAHTSPPSWRRGLKPPNPESPNDTQTSPPSWRRGLKLNYDHVEDRKGVASLMEAWIETTRSTRSRGSSRRSPPSWRRGLKQFCNRPSESPSGSPPSWRRGLKLLVCDHPHGIESPPSWRRGLKHELAPEVQE